MNYEMNPVLPALNGAVLYQPAGNHPLEMYEVWLHGKLWRYARSWWEAKRLYAYAAAKGSSVKCLKAIGSYVWVVNKLADETNRELYLARMRAEGLR